MDEPSVSKENICSKAEPIKKKNVFKENWLKVDETCPACHQITKRQKGITKQNLKRLITPQFNMTEILITFMIIMVLALAFVYNYETKECRDWLKEMTSGDCVGVCDYKCRMLEANERKELNVSNLTIANDGMNEFNGTP